MGFSGLLKESQAFFSAIGPSYESLLGPMVEKKNWDFWANWRGLSGCLFHEIYFLHKLHLKRS